MMPSAQQLYTVCEATWPPARSWVAEGWTLRDGAGGGKRVSAATQAMAGAEIAVAERAMSALGQTPLFMVREGEDTLDHALDQRGYDIVDPVTLYAIPIGALTDIPIPRVTAFAIWEPLAIMAEIWAAGGIGPARIDVMARASVKTAILARWNEKPAGAGFAGVHDGICMVHAVEVMAHQRRQGVAQWIMRRAAFWGQDRGATHVSVLCTKANHAANALYLGLGFDAVGTYHYRQQNTT